MMLPKLMPFVPDAFFGSRVDGAVGDGQGGFL
jgi:hypothetical protein